MVDALLTKGYFAVQRILMTSDNPANFLKGDGDGTFSGLQAMFQGVFASGYKLLMAIGIAILVCAGIAAAILFGLIPDHTKVKENRAWILRVLIAAAIVGAMLTLVGLFFNIGAGVTVAPTPTPTPTP